LGEDECRTYVQHVGRDEKDMRELDMRYAFNGLVLTLGSRYLMSEISIRQGKDVSFYKLREYLMITITKMITRQ
jgi:hypothetical protein